MLNKREKSDVCSLLAEWEWNEASTSSGAAEVGKCAYELRNLFNINNNDEDLQFARAYRITQIAKRYHSDAQENWFLYELCDMVEEDYENVKNLMEIGRNFEGLVEEVRKRR